MTIANIQKGDKPHGFTLVFGDSFIGPLKLFKHPRWIFVKFKGGTMKGLTKPDNENRQIIANTIAKFKNSNRLNAVIFCFGTVDIQFSYYYNKLMNKPFAPGEIIDGYIKFIKSVIDPKKYKVGVQLAYPSAVAEYNMLIQLEIYHILDDFYGVPKRDLTVELTATEHDKLRKIYNKLKDTKQPEAQKILAPDFTFESRIARLHMFNTLIKHKLYGTHISYIDMGKHITDAKGYVKPEFIDLSVINVHFRWEPQIPFMLREFKYYGLSDKYMGDIKKIIATEKKYLKEKEKELRMQKPKSQSRIKSISKIAKTKKGKTTTESLKRRKTQINKLNKIKNPK